MAMDLKVLVHHRRHMVGLRVIIGHQGQAAQCMVHRLCTVHHIMDRCMVLLLIRRILDLVAVVRIILMVLIIHRACLHRRTT